MASVTKSGNGWRAQVRVVGYKGKSKSFGKGEKTKAWAWAHEYERNLKAQKRGEYPSHTLLEALQSFAKHEAPKHKGSRWEVVRTRKFKSYTIAKKILGDVTDDDMALWREARLGQVSNATVRREMVLWGQVFEYAREKLRWIPKNIMREVKKPSVKKTTPKPLPLPWIDRMVKGLGPAHKHREVALGFLLGCETAMRPWEMIPLEKRQVAWDEQVARLEDTKNGDDREVPLSLAAISILRELEAMNPESDTFFTVSEGSVTAMWGEVRNAQEGLKGFHFRHSRREGIRRLSKRLPILDLARAVGHRDLNSLMIYYQESASEMAKKLDLATPSHPPPAIVDAPHSNTARGPENQDDTPP